MKNRLVSYSLIVAFVAMMAYAAASSIARGQSANDHLLYKWDGTQFQKVYISPNSNDLIGWSSGSLSNVARSTFAAASHNQAWSTITSTPDTLAGYGITDAQPLNANTTILGSDIDLASEISGVLAVTNGGTGGNYDNAAMLAQGLFSALVADAGSGVSPSDGMMIYYTGTPGMGGDWTHLSGTTSFGRGLLQLSAYPTFNQNTTGNAATATALQTARTINGTSFNGTANITVTAAADTLTGPTLASGVTASSLTSLGTLTALNVNGIGTITRSGLATTTTSALVLQNSTAAAAGAQQVSPSLDLIGQGWKTNATAASQSAGMRLHVLPVQGTSAPTAELRISSVINGVESNLLNIDSAGGITKIGGTFWIINSGGSLTLGGGTIKAGDNFFSGGFIYPGNATTGGSFTYGGEAGIIDMRGYFAPTQPQLLRPHNTYTSATNYERGKLGWESNSYVIGTEKGSGGGTARPVVIQTDGVTRITINADGTITLNGLQTSAGATGTLYSDGGVLKVSP